MDAHAVTFQPECTAALTCGYIWLRPQHSYAAPGPPLQLSASLRHVISRRCARVHRDRPGICTVHGTGDHKARKASSSAVFFPRAESRKCQKVRVIRPL